MATIKKVKKNSPHIDSEMEQKATEQELIKESTPQEEFDVKPEKEIEERKEEFDVDEVQKLREKIEKTDLDDMLKMQASAHANDLKVLDEEKKMKKLVALAKARGVIYAVSVAKKMDDPYILDMLHDFLAKEGYYKKFAE